MALRAKVGSLDLDHKIGSISITEDVSPLLHSDDSPAGVGSFTITTQHATTGRYQRQTDVRIEDDERGFFEGRVSSASGGAGSPLSLSGESALVGLIGQVRARPFNGSLQSAMHHYMDLASVPVPIAFESGLATMPVVLPAFNGSLWEVLAKRIAPVLGVELSFVQDRLWVRRHRSRRSSVTRITPPTWTQDSTQPTTAVTVAYYGRTWSHNALLYPGPKGWTGEESVISVDAGAEIEVELSIPASALTIAQPVYVSSMSPTGTSSAYTVVGSDDLPITPAFWKKEGGSLTVRPSDDDPMQLIVTIKAPPIAEYAPYRLAMSDGASDYPALRIRGTGVLLERKEIRVETGLEAPSEAVVAVDDIMIGSASEACDIAAGLVSIALGNRQRLDFTAASVAPPRGVAAGFGDVTSPSLPSTFGNVAGSRFIMDEGVYRAASATHSTHGTAISAVQDTTIADTRAMRAGQTIAQSKIEKAGARIRDVNATPLRKDWR